MRNIYYGFLFALFTLHPLAGQGIPFEIFVADDTPGNSATIGATVSVPGGVLAVRPNGEADPNLQTLRYFEPGDQTTSLVEGGWRPYSHPFDTETPREDNHFIVFNYGDDRLSLMEKATRMIYDYDYRDAGYERLSAPAFMGGSVYVLAWGTEGSGNNARAVETMLRFTTAAAPTVVFQRALTPGQFRIDASATIELATDGTYLYHNRPPETPNFSGGGSREYLYRYAPDGTNELVMAQSNDSAESKLFGFRSAENGIYLTAQNFDGFGSKTTALSFLEEGTFDVFNLVDAPPTPFVEATHRLNGRNLLIAGNRVYAHIDYTDGLVELISSSGTPKTVVRIGEDELLILSRSRCAGLFTTDGTPAGTGLFMAMNRRCPEEGSTEVASTIGITAWISRGRDPTNLFVRSRSGPHRTSER